MTTEQTFNAANKYLRARVNVLNNMSSRELSAQLLPELRAMSFFSARVAEARVLEKLRSVSDRYSAGQMDAATARLEIKQWLKVGDNVKAENIREALMSTARLDLILNQNQMMAAAVGARELALDPEIYEALPYYRFVPSTAANPRDSHRQFYGVVLDKKDAFWNTHTPPLDFGCKCSLDELTAAEAGDRVGKVNRRNGESETNETNAPNETNSSWSVSTPDGDVTVDAPESGFSFDVSAPFSVNDLGRLNMPFRAGVVDKMSELAATGKMGRLSFLGAEPNDFEMVRPDMSKVGPAMDKLIAPARAAVKVAAEKAPADFLSAFPGKSLSLGTLLPELSSSLGIGEVPVSLSRGNGGMGLAHEWIHHSEVFLTPGETVRILSETLFNKGARTAMSVIPKKKGKPRTVLAFHNPATKAFCVVEVVNGKAEMLSWHRVEEDYTNYEWLLENKKGITR